MSYNNKPNLINIIFRDKRQFLLVLAIWLVGALLYLVIFIIFNEHNGNNPKRPSYDKNDSTKTLLLMGGGSVAAYLDTLYSEKAREKFALPDSVNMVFSMGAYPHTKYLHMPSGLGVPLLMEEVFIHEDIEKKSFYPVCLSAMRIGLNEFIKACGDDVEQIKDAGRIIEFYLGEEQMVVYAYCKEDEYSKGDESNINELLKSVGVGPESKKITVGQLRDLICKIRDKHNNAKQNTDDEKIPRVFCTSEKSGTYYAYNQELDAINKNEKDKSKIINLDSIKSKASMYFYSSYYEQPFFGTSCVILGGQYFYPKTFQKLLGKQFRQLFLVKNDNKKPCTHQLYFYTMAYMKSEGVFVVPDEIVDFLDFFDLEREGFIGDDNILDEFTSTMIKAQRKKSLLGCSR